MGELEVLPFAAEEDVVDGGAPVRRGQDVAGVSVAKKVDLFLLKFGGQKLISPSLNDIIGDDIS